MRLSIILLILILLLLIYVITYNYNNNNKPYTLGVMLIFKNEEMYLEEWLSYHIKQGIDRFYLYCNDINKEKYKFLDSYISYIKVIDWTNKTNNGNMTVQRQAYFDCIKNYSNECKYMMMLDTDEFIVNKEKDKKVIDYINNLNYNDTKALKVQRFNFGSNNNVQKPTGRVIDNYTKRENICSSFKTIANTNYIDTKQHFFGVHDFPMKNKNGKIYNEYLNYNTGYPNGCTVDFINETPLVINHYYIKSYDEYIDRCKMWENGGINPIGYRQDCVNQFKIKDSDVINEIYDDIIINK
jgi:hypothetical protein